ncbi:MAG: 16S rRNA (guanine(527)-N(7))-methyltransferase RsmG [Prevotellaceae bacterium]|jgi:16S rRNA (guanine527-N7)-methyltransferase|nr:16S rRNA (guanine(527)-N(7))-methyltransferase RsmG [Prevotellaceae bacterium]
MSELPIVSKYFSNLTTRQQEQFAKLPELYSYWNERINVVSRKDIEELPTRHVLHSLAIAKVATFASGTKILDAGTGGGFPGIPLAIMFPQCSFMLVDSIGKKIKVVAEVAQSLGLSNVHAQQIRAEELRQNFDFVVSRAVTDLPTFMSWIWNKISTGNNSNLPNGLLYLKGGDLTEELKSVKQKVDLFNISDFFSEDFFETKKVVYVKR